MTATHDPALCARLIAEARRDDERMTPAPWTSDAMSTSRDYGSISGPRWPVAQICYDDDRRPVTSEFDPGECVTGDINGIARMRNSLRALADQLEAAKATIDQLSVDLAAATRSAQRIGTERDAARFEADETYAERDALRAEVAECKARIRDHEEQHERALNDQRGLRAEVAQLNARLGRIAERCRNTPGKCFCEAHVSDQQGSCPMPNPKPLSPERLAEIRNVLGGPSAAWWHKPALELFAELDRLRAALHLAARITDEPCPLCLSLAGESEVCALHHEIDEMGHHATRHAKRIAALEVEVGEAKLVIEQQDRDLERTKTRIAALETGLMEATNWIADRSSEESILVNRLRAIIGGEP